MIPNLNVSTTTAAGPADANNGAVNVGGLTINRGGIGTGSPAGGGPLLLLGVGALALLLLLKK